MASKYIPMAKRCQTVKYGGQCKHAATQLRPYHGDERLNGPLPNRMVVKLCDECAGGKT